MSKRAVVAGILGASSLAVGAGTASPAASKPSAFDVYYLKSSIQGDIFEIKGGTIAKSKGHNSAVRALGARLVKDHSKSLSDAQKLTRRLGISVPKSPTPPEQWELKQVSSASGSAFDKAYSSLEVMDHEQDISDTTDEIRSGSDAAVRAEARKDLPILKTHLALSRKAVKASASE